MTKTLEREIESKFDIPSHLDLTDMITKVTSHFLTHGWSLQSSHFVTCHFVFYDTPLYHAYHRNDTIRRVSFLEDTKDRKAKFRYDLKVGSIEERQEQNHWSNQLYSPEQIIDSLDLKSPYTNIHEVAKADTRHHKYYFEKGKTELEVTYDLVTLPQTTLREMEIELIRGNKRSQELISHNLQDILQLEKIITQKYNRILEAYIQP